MAIIHSGTEIRDENHNLALRYMFIVGGVELLERYGLTKFCPKLIGKRSDKVSLTGTETNKNTRWRDLNFTIHRKDAKKIIGAVIEIGVITAMNTHIYSFNGTMYIQCQGGPIGLHLTAALANLVMCYFDLTLREILKDNMLKVSLSFRFVDDSRFGMCPIKPGWRWTQNPLVFNKEHVENNRANGEDIKLCCPIP